jgi:hypothetical protein
LTLSDHGGGSRSSSTPFSNNAFTTVSPSFIPKSPSRCGRKRYRDDDSRSGSPQKRSKH